MESTGERENRGRHKLWLTVPLLLTLLIVFYMQFTNPLTAGPAGILGLFILLYLLFMSLTFLSLAYGVGFLRRIKVLKRGNNVAPRKAYYVASVLACFPVFLLAIMSMGQLAFWDVVWAALFIALATFYVVRKT